MDVAIIKYNSGNVFSVQNALLRLGITSIITDDPEAIKRADKVIFPGVGHASPAMQYLRERKLDKLIISLQQPVLGICLGMQLMCSYSEEGDTECLGIFDTAVRLFKSEALKVPQVGWNDLYDTDPNLFAHLDKNSFVYYVHSYYAERSLDTIAKTNYILEYSAALRKNNFFAVQFHPEKSGDVGARILKNFFELS